jgi:spore germination cell wall hydrolase CwlJ-like protein
MKSCLNWYDTYQISLALNSSQMSKEAGFKENLSGLAFAVSLFFGGMDIAEAAQKAKVPVEHVHRAVKQVKDKNSQNKIPIKKEIKKEVSTEEQIARTLFAEAAGETLEGKKAVASVIWNRANGNKDSLLDIIKKPKQFSCWNSGMPKAGTGQAWNDCLSIAKEMINGTFSPTTKHSHYYAPAKADPKWAYVKTKKGKVLREHDDIGNHRFLTI